MLLKANLLCVILLKVRILKMKFFMLFVNLLFLHYSFQSGTHLWVVFRGDNFYWLRFDTTASLGQYLFVY